MAHRANPLNASQGAKRPPTPKPPSSLSRPGRKRHLLPLLALCQLLLLGLLLWAPLPNVGNVGEELRRGIFLMAAIPGMVPDLPFRETITGQALEQLSQLENLPQRLPIVLAATLIATAAAGLGRLVLVLLRLDQKFSTWEILPLSFGLGVLALAAITLGIGRLGLLDPWLVRLGLAACLLVGWGMPAIRSLTDRHKINEKLSTFQLVSTNWPATLGLFLIAAPFLTLMALGAMQPTIEYDALEYHLQGPKEFYQSGRIAFLPHNVYTSMPFGVEMLHLLGMLVLDDWWKGALVGQLLIASFAPATAAMIALTAFRIGSARAAWIAAVIYISTPWVFRLATYPFVEGPLCFYHAALIWIIFKTFVDNNNRDLNDKPALRPPPSAISPPPSVIRPPPSVLRPPPLVHHRCPVGRGDGLQVSWTRLGGRSVRLVGDFHCLAATSLADLAGVRGRGGGGGVSLADPQRD